MICANLSAYHDKEHFWGALLELEILCGGVLLTWAKHQQAIEEMAMRASGIAGFVASVLGGRFTLRFRASLEQLTGRSFVFPQAYHAQCIHIYTVPMQVIRSHPNRYVGSSGC